MENLLGNLPDELPQELFQQLLSGSSFRMQRIVSRGHVSQEEFWYDQQENEWVLLRLKRQ